MSTHSIFKGMVGIILQKKRFGCFPKVMNLVREQTWNWTQVILFLGFMNLNIIFSRKKRFSPNFSWTVMLFLVEWCWTHLFPYLATKYYFFFKCPVQFSSVAQSCPNLCNPMDCSTPGLPIHHKLPEFTQTHAHRVSDAIQPSHPLSSPSLPALNPSQYQGLFQWVNSLHEVAKVLEFQL